MLTKYNSRRRVRPDHLTVISYRQCPPNYILKETISDWFVNRLPEPQISVYGGVWVNNMYVKNSIRNLMPFSIAVNGRHLR